MFLRCIGRSQDMANQPASQPARQDNNKSSSEVLMRCKLCLMVDAVRRE